MKRFAAASSSQVTKLLVACIVVAAVALVWLVYAQLIAPRLAANIPLDSQVCFPDSQLCLNYPKSWTITKELSDNLQIFSFENTDETRQLTVAVGEIASADECDQRERRALHIISSQPTDLLTKDSAVVNLVQAVVETAADGFYVPAIYLTADQDHRQVGEIQSCALESANIWVNQTDHQVYTGVDAFNEPVGSNTPAYRSLGEAKQWLSTPDATVSYRILASLQYQ